MRANNYNTGRQQSTVQSIVKRYKNENQFENKHQSGRPTKLSECENCFILIQINKNPFESSTIISAGK